MVINELTIRKIIRETVDGVMSSGVDSELESLVDYLSREADVDVRKGVNLSADAYNYFIYPQIVKNKWCVHFTNAEGMDGIMRSGFNKGVGRMEALAYSQAWGDGNNQQEGGWCFAVPASSNDLQWDRGYGDCGFILRTDGVMAYHKLDAENEVMFKGYMVKEMYAFYYEEDADVYVPFKWEAEERCGGRYDDDMGCVVFDDIYDLVKYVTGGANLCESESDGGGFGRWKAEFDGYLEDMLEELRNGYLSMFGLSVEIDGSYAFTGRARNWYAVYEGRSSSGKISKGVIVIGVNYPHLYNEMKKRGIDEDPFNIKAQARITVGHEISHGILDYIRCNREKMPKPLKALAKAGARQEERIAEEFGECMFPEATGAWGCELLSVLDGMIAQGYTAAPLTEGLVTHDDEYNIFEKLDEYDIDYDFIDCYDKIAEITTPDRHTRDKVIQMLNVYGWKVIKDNGSSIAAERMYGDSWNNFDDIEAWRDNQYEDEYPYGTGIYYHITTTNKAGKILKQGLTVREGNKLGYARGERTYLITYPDEQLARQMYRDGGDITILLVDISKYIGGRINVYHDDFTGSDGAVYTYDYIPPECIKVFKRFKIRKKGGRRMS